MEAKIHDGGELADHLHVFHAIDALIEMVRGWGDPALHPTRIPRLVSSEGEGR